MIRVGKQRWQPIAYKDYIKSEAWAERKRIYYLSHPHLCEVCGHPDVDLHHLDYGNFGNEKDKNLAALCRIHHEEVHSRIPLRKNMYYHTRRLIDQMKEERAEMLQKPQITSESKAQRGVDVERIIETMANPIWRALELIGIKRPRR
jgi:hypothetical protein